MLSNQQISDRIELEQLVVAYAYAIDERAFERLDRIFTPDAHIDYRAAGGIAGSYPEIRKWLPEALGIFPGYMHFIGNFAFDIDGDSARSEEHTSELQSLMRISYAVFCLKKKKKKKQ